MLGVAGAFFPLLRSHVQNALASRITGASIVRPVRAAHRRRVASLGPDAETSSRVISSPSDCHRSIKLVIQLVSAFEKRSARSSFSAVVAGTMEKRAAIRVVFRRGPPGAPGSGRQSSTENAD